MKTWRDCLLFKMKLLAIFNLVWSGLSATMYFYNGYSPIYAFCAGISLGVGATMLVSL